MNLVISLKKLIFAIPFLVLFYLCLFQLGDFFKDIYLIFGVSLDTFLKFIYLSVSFILASFLFVVFAIFADDWIIISGVSFVAAISALIFLPSPFSFLITLGLLGSFLIIFYSLHQKLKSYIDFKPGFLFTPSVKTLTGLSIFVISIGFFLQTIQIINTQGFKVPDSLLNTAYSFIPKDNIQTPTLPATSDEIATLKKSPQLLSQYGIDPSILDSLNQPQTNSSQNLIKTTLQSQIESMIKPSEGYIPIFLAAIFFLTLNSISSFLSILIPLLLNLLFLILEKSNFIHFQTETREVRKMTL